MVKHWAEDFFHHRLEMRVGRFNDRGLHEIPHVSSVPPPATIRASSADLAKSMYDLILSNDFRSMTALMKLPKSSGDPILGGHFGFQLLLQAGHMEAGMYARDAALHF